MKIVDGDRIVTVEGMTLQEAFQSETGRATLEKFRTSKVGDTLSMVVLRDGQEVELKGAAEMVNKVERHFIEISPTPTPAQTALKRAVYYE